MGPPTLQLGMCVSTWWPFECADACSFMTLTQSDDYRYLFTITAPCAFILHPTNTLSPLPLGRHIWELFCSLLAWLPCKYILSLLQISASQCFGLLWIRQNEPGSVTYSAKASWWEKSRWTFCPWLTGPLQELRACGQVRAPASSVSSGTVLGFLWWVLPTFNALFSFAAEKQVVLGFGFGRHLLGM